jgi:hypothetical protein
VRVRNLAEVRDLPIDAGEVFEIGRRREEEDVDTLGLHALAEPPAPLRVVEHHETLEPSQDLASPELDAIPHVKSRVAGAARVRARSARRLLKRPQMVQRLSVRHACASGASAP